MRRASNPNPYDNTQNISTLTSTVQILHKKDVSVDEPEELEFGRMTPLPENLGTTMKSINRNVAKIDNE